MKGIQRIGRWSMLLLALALGLSATRGAQPVQAWQSRVEPSALAAAAAGESEFLVLLRDQADLSAAAGLATQAQKGRYVMAQLQTAATRSQGAVIAAIQRRGAAYQAYWIANLVWVRGPADLMIELAQRSDVRHIYANPATALHLPEATGQSAAQSMVTVEWNLLKVRAPDVWAQGVYGQGVVIGGQDTGFDWSHPALQGHYRGWDGENADHNYDWHDAIHTQIAPSPNTLCPPNQLEPCDDYNHGTHTMGIMVGSDGGQNQIGMAPGARWIGCRNMDKGYGTPATYTECYQWFVAPTDLNGENPQPDLAPQVINNSWGCTPAEGCKEPDILQLVVENVRAAGILTVHSAGNYGPACGTVREPATIYAASFSVGSSGTSDQISSFSSRGPVTFDGSNRLKPQVVAPGESIRSSVLGDSYSTLSGTSMAAPHVAGMAALMISANPALAGQPQALERLIQLSAVPIKTIENCGGTAYLVPNNTYGWGRIDALNAVQLARSQFSFLPLISK